MTAEFDNMIQYAGSTLGDTMQDTDHANHWYLPPFTSHPSVVSAVHAAATEQMRRYHKHQFIHAHEPGFPCSRECEAMP